MFLPKRRKGALKLKYLPADSILPNPYQPRREESGAEDAKLCESIRRLGVLQPLTVHIREDGAAVLISGERRLKAARAANFSKVPCLVVTASDIMQAVQPLCEDMHRVPLTDFEQAAALRRLTEGYRLSRTAAAELLGIHESAVGSALRLLRLNDAQRERVLAAGLSKRHIQALARIDSSLRDKAIDAVITRNLSAEDTERIANGVISLQTNEDKSRKRTAGVGDIRLFDNSLQRMVEALNAAGVRSSTAKRETDTFVEYVVRINKPERRSSGEKTEKQLALF